ncbi:MAG TPA: hypothetical protein VG456_16215 [Candidatus Sulfopaludibacter sp.]|nr:hypothetical protein [Candidatus Sulfopaludibacter sp.]
MKIDENLPIECAVLLRNAGFEADTVFDESLALTCAKKAPAAKTAGVT